MNYNLQISADIRREEISILHQTFFLDKVSETYDSILSNALSSSLRRAMETFSLLDHSLPISLSNITNHAAARNPLFRPKSTRTVWKLHAEPKGFGSLQAQEQTNSKRLRNGSGPSTARRDNRSTKNINEDKYYGGYPDEKIQDEVMNSMISRILYAVGIPFVIGIGFLLAFEAVKENRWFEVPVWLPFLTTFITLGASTLGIVYGALSTNWDGGKQDSFLGFEEVQKNWIDMWTEEDDERE